MLFCVDSVNFESIFINALQSSAVAKNEEDWVPFVESSRLCSCCLCRMMLSPVITKS